MVKSGPFVIGSAVVAFLGLRLTALLTASHLISYYEELAVRSHGSC